MHGRLRFLVNNHPIPRAELEDRGGYCHKSQTTMHYVLYFQPDWSLLLYSSTQGSLWETSFYNFLWYMKQNLTSYLYMKK